MKLFGRYGYALITLAGLAWIATTPTPTRAAGLTYHKDIMPILQKHCLNCHHAGGTAPQSLETYAKSRPWIRPSKKTMNDKSMPPWHADPTVGKFKNMNLPTADEIRTIVQWVDDGADEGDVKDAPKPMTFVKGWQRGDPEKVFEMPEAVSIPAEGPDLYRATIVSPAFADDTWVSGIQLLPGEQDCVLDMTLSAAPEAAAKEADAADEGPGFKVFDRAWAKGTKDDLAVWNRGMSQFENCPEGTGVLIPKGSVLVLAIHYKTVGDPLKDKSKVGLNLAKAPAAKELKTLAIENRQIDIPPQSFEHKIAAEATLEKPAKIYTILPRMHYLGMKLDLTAQPPSGAAQKLLKIDNYNYKLQTLYTLAEPVTLPAGTKLSVTAYYENSTDNPHNPNQVVKKAAYGPAPTGEMLSVVLQYAEQ